MRGKFSDRLRQSPDLGESGAASQAQSLLDSGDIVAAAALASSLLGHGLNPVENARLTFVKAIANFEAGLVTESLQDLRRAAALAEGRDNELEFAARLALFSRESQFSEPAEMLLTLGRVRQLAAGLGNPNALAGLHLAVARLEAYRGHCVDARRHLEIARTAAAGTNRPMLGAAINLVDASLELIAGNLRRATRSAKEGYEQSSQHGFGILRAGSVTNLGHLALTKLEISRARDYLNQALEQTTSLSFIRLGALDSLLQLSLHVDDLDCCDRLLKECSKVIAEQVAPSKSWYDLAHQVTRCAILSHLSDWETIVDLTSEIDIVVEARQFRSIRTVLLCAAATAFANLGEIGKSQSRLKAAVQVCPRGAVDPLIVLEAASGTCFTLGGDVTRGDAHFERALSAARAIGNNLQEVQIETARRMCRSTKMNDTSRSRSDADSVNGSSRLLLADVATILGAGSSVDLLAHRAVSIVQGTPLERQLRVRHLSDQEFQSEVSIESSETASGDFEVRLRGSDRLVVQARA